MNANDVHAAVGTLRRCHSPMSYNSLLHTDAGAAHPQISTGTGTGLGFCPQGALLASMMRDSIYVKLTHELKMIKIGTTQT